MSQWPWRTGNPSAFPGLDADWGSTPAWTSSPRTCSLSATAQTRAAPTRLAPSPRAPTDPLVLALDVAAAVLVLSR
ncbi:hypothetical protein [Streptomyces sp. 3214.6]|uniref:hypothetical protein n=1 Tax=Streptomyces sp. 3214.6 TaxID=1882757 RepID=UPI00090B33B1|nr:hypothetical protein [Streptomyces sp. 3214.6]SHH80697.1 hypothetical protein SAMN05444521_2007 [Streptomyces sp. 3214.6]